MLKSYDCFRGDSNEKTWMFSISRHIVIDHFRKQKRRRARIFDHFNVHEQGEFIPDPSAQPDDILFLNERIKRFITF